MAFVATHFMHSSSFWFLFELCCLQKESFSRFHSPHIIKLHDTCSVQKSLIPYEKVYKIIMTCTNHCTVLRVLALGVNKLYWYFFFKLFVVFIYYWVEYWWTGFKLKNTDFSILMKLSELDRIYLFFRETTTDMIEFAC